MKALHIMVGRPAKVIDLPETPSLDQWQKLVGGYIEPLDGAIGGLRAYVNEDGIATKRVNRAIYADEAMVARGCVSQIDGKRIDVGDVYTLVFGDFVVYAGEPDEDGEIHLRDMTPEEIEHVRSMHGISETESGVVEALRIRTRRP